MASSGACADALRIEPYDFPSEEEYMRQEYLLPSPENADFLNAFTHVHVDEMYAASPR